MNGDFDGTLKIQRARKDLNIQQEVKRIDYDNPTLYDCLNLGMGLPGSETSKRDNNGYMI